MKEHPFKKKKNKCTKTYRWSLGFDHNLSRFFFNCTSRFEIYDLKLKKRKEVKIVIKWGRQKKKSRVLKNTCAKIIFKVHAKVHFHNILIRLWMCMREKRLVHWTKGSQTSLEFVIMVAKKKVFILTFCVSC